MFTQQYQTIYNINGIFYMALLFRLDDFYSLFCVQLILHDNNKNRPPQMMHPIG